MIEVVTGLIGGGKSCLVIYRVLEYIANGGRVYMNMRLTDAVEVYDIETQKMSLILPPDAPLCKILRKRYKWEFQQGQYNYLVEDDMEGGFQNTVPPGTPEKKVLVVLDEVNEWFDSKDRSRINTEKAYRDTLRFLRQSRKVYIDVIFILQVFSTLDNRIRDLVGFAWQCRDMQYFEVAGLSVGWMFKRFFVWQKFYKDMKVAIAKPRWVTKDLEIFKCYDTTELFGDGLCIAPAGSVRTDFTGAGKIVKTYKGKKMNKLQNAALILCCLSSAFGCFMVYKGNGGVSAGPVRVVTVTNQLGFASSVMGSAVSAGARVKGPMCEWAPLAYGRAGDVEWCYAAGRMYRPGVRTDKGMCVSVDRFSVRLINEDGEHFIFHSDMQQPLQGSSVADNRGSK